MNDNDILKAIGDNELDSIELAHRLEQSGHRNVVERRASNELLRRVWKLVDRGELQFTLDRKIQRRQP